jgi:hypothetical protein
MIRGSTEQLTPPDVLRLVSQRTAWPTDSSSWSLAELALSDDELAALIAWARGLSATRFDRILSGLEGSLAVDDLTISVQAMTGLALLLAFAEIARRDATEGRLWSHVRQRLGESSAGRAALFDAGGQPTHGTKKLLERAARHFGLRHAFDLADDDGYGHHWYTTVFLQFGFTHRGFIQNAAYWFRNMNLSRAVRLLLDRQGLATGFGPALYSPSFEKTWTTLLLGARKNICGDDLRRQLRNSKWICSSSVDAFAANLESLDWTALGDETAFDYADEDEPPGDTFIGRTFWRYDQTGPTVVAELTGIATLELAASYYDIVVDGRRIGRLMPSGDAPKLITDPRLAEPSASFSFRLPHPLRPHMVASLVDPTGATRAEQQLRLWSAESAFCVMRLRPGASTVLEPGSALPDGDDVLLIADSSLELAAAEAHQHPLDDERFFAARLPADSRDACRLLADGHEVWAPSTGGSSREVRREALEVRVLDPPGRPGGPHGAVSVSITPAPGIDLLSVRRDGARCQLTQGGGRAWTCDVPLAGRTPSDRLVLLVVYSAGSRLSARRVVVDLPLCGFFRVRGSTLEVAPPTRTITRGSVMAGRYVFYPPNDERDTEGTRRDWFMFEGRRPLARMPARGQPRLAPIGLGAGLVARRGPLNALDSTNLAAGVVDFGDLRPGHDVSLETDGAVSFAIHDSLIDQVDEYAIAVWDRSGRIISGQIVEVNEPARGFTGVRALTAEPPESILALGLCYRGHRAGAMWASDWHRYIRNLADRDVGRAAALLRWLQLPVLEPHALVAIRHECLHSNAVALFSAWTASSTVHSDDAELSLVLGDAGLMQPGAIDTCWYWALREVVGDWVPSVDAIEAFIDALVGDAPADYLHPTPLIFCLANLVRIHPRLAIGVAARYPAAIGDSRFRDTLMAQLAHHLADASSGRELDEAVESLEVQSAQTLGAILRQEVDPVFVRSLTGHACADDGWLGSARTKHATTAAPASYDDSMLLCQFPHGRRLLAICAAIGD